jgi:prepilin-type N-terminal cleavage/methylation domain-containing protein
VAIFLVLLIVPIIVGTIYYRTSESIKSQTISQITTEGNIASAALQLKLNRLTNIASSLASSPEIISAATKGSWDSAANVARDAQNNVSFYDPYIDRIVFADTTGLEKSAYPTLEGGVGADLSGSTWFASFAQGNKAIIISPVSERRATPVLNVVNIVAPITSNGTMVGFVLLQIRTANFLEFDYALSTGTYGFTYIVDNKGNIVAHPKYSSSVGVVNIASTLPVQDLLNNQSGVMITNDAQKDLIAYKTVPAYDWGIVIQEPYDEAFASYESITQSMLLLETVLLLIDVLISYLIFRFLSHQRKSEGASSPTLKNSGFTLIELLVVIAIIAILSIVVVLTLNPAEMLRQSRDSNRISDLSTMKSAVSLYLVDAANPNIASSTSGGYGACYLSTIAGQGTSTAHCGIFTNTGGVGVSTTAALYRKNDSTGWLPVNFSQISLGTPLASLPIDPTNNTNYYYAYAATTTGGYFFEFDTFMESQKYKNGGSNDVASKDGGDNPNVYEVGNYPSLSL